MLTSLSIPSPSDAIWYLGPVPIRGYALSIILGIIVAIWLAERRWVARGGQSGEIADLAVWGIPFGLIGGRLYHVLTDNNLYFGAMGALGIIIAARRKGIRLLPVLDAIAPTVLVAQAIGRWGNWFNQELFGKPTDLPWALEIDAEHRPPGYFLDDTFHPTFLYEFLWNLGAFGFVVWADRRFRLGYGRVAALYVMAYTLGRGWIEMLRIDNVELQNVGGLRFNVWTSIVLFVAAAIYFVVSLRRHPGREESVYVRDDAEDAAAPSSGEAGNATA
jgi:prolipoprotein diacylglyceryl transferase